METKKNYLLQILLGVYTVLYLLAFIIPFFQGEYSLYVLNDLVVFILFLVFASSFALSWNKKKTAAIIIMIWNVVLWFFCLYIDRTGGGMPIILGLPGFIFGILLMDQWYKESRDPQASKKQQRKYILQCLLINYVFLYVIYLISDIIYSAPIDFFAIPGLLFPILLALFIAGSLLSFKYELYAGIIFVLWYAIVAFTTFTYFELADRGPIIGFGVTLLVQGLFYIDYHRMFNKQQTAS